jgi:hypothetical protein
MLEQNFKTVLLCVFNRQIIIYLTNTYVYFNITVPNAIESKII